MARGLFCFPVSVMLAAVFVVGVLLCRRCLDKSVLLGTLSGRTFSSVMLAVTALLMAVEGTWSLGLFHNPAFLVIMLLMMFCLGLSFSMTHTGFLVLCVGWFFGSQDSVAGYLQVSPDRATSYAVSSKGMAVPLEMELRLKEFRIDYYPDGVSPRQYTSVLEVDGEEMTTAVNRPCSHKGWLIYQADYDKLGERYSVLQAVRDPWLPVVFAGMLLLALGALMDMRRTWQSKAVLPVVLGLAVVFSVISLSRIKFGTLVPALRSLWFVPHLIIYMLAYSVLAVSAVLSLVGRDSARALAFKLCGTASSLLLLGMLCGAVWAKYAWGDFWTWDAKECWAAVTWLLTLVVLHLPRRALRSRWAVAAVILLSFAAMQVTWYGVKYLPSAQYSMHTYR